MHHGIDNYPSGGCPILKSVKYFELFLSFLVKIIMKHHLPKAGELAGHGHKALPEEVAYLMAFPGLEDANRERDFYPDLGGILVDFTISEPAISPSISDIMVTSLLGMQTSSW